MANFIIGIISLSVSTVLLSSLFIATVKGTTTCVAGTLGAVCNGTAGFGTNATGVGGVAFTPAEVTLWGLMALLAIVGLVFGVMQVFGIA